MTIEIPPAKCARPQKVLRPHRGLFRRIQKLADHPGDSLRIRRWENYKDGMTLLECKEGEGTTTYDVKFYVDNKLMKLITPTEDEYQAGLEDWYTRNNMESPAERARKREKEREAKKAERIRKAEKREAEKAERARKREAEKVSKVEKLKAERAKTRAMKLKAERVKAADAELKELAK